MKIGMYTEEEIYEELANGFLQRSMVDAMYFKIKDLQQENQLLKDRLEKAIGILECSENMFGQRALEILKGDKE